MELARLLLADFDPGVVCGIVAQPFQPQEVVGGKSLTARVKQRPVDGRS